MAKFTVDLIPAYATRLRALAKANKRAPEGEAAMILKVALERAEAEKGFREDPLLLLLEASIETNRLLDRLLRQLLEGRADGKST